MVQVGSYVLFAVHKGSEWNHRYCIYHLDKQELYQLDESFPDHFWSASISNDGKHLYKVKCYEEEDYEKTVAKIQVQSLPVEDLATENWTTTQLEVNTLRFNGKKLFLIDSNHIVQDGTFYIRGMTMQGEGSMEYCTFASDLTDLSQQREMLNHACVFQPPKNNDLNYMFKTYFHKNYMVTSREDSGTLLIRRGATLAESFPWKYNQIYQYANIIYIKSDPHGKENSKIIIFADDSYKVHDYGSQDAYLLRACKSSAAYTIQGSIYMVDNNLYSYLDEGKMGKASIRYFPSNKALSVDLACDEDDEVLKTLI